jgi:hypothetical protein
MSQTDDARLDLQSDVFERTRNLKGLISGVGIVLDQLGKHRPRFADHDAVDVFLLIAAEEVDRLEEAVKAYLAAGSSVARGQS